MKKLIKGICIVAVVVIALTATAFMTGCGRKNSQFNGCVEHCLNYNN